MPMPDPLVIQPIAPFDVTLRLPGSKSLTNRALLLAALADGASELTGVLFSDDTRRMLDALARLGFTLDIDEPARRATVHGQGGVIPASAAEIDLGNAGTAMRFLTAACCLGHGTYILDGIARMRERPIAQLVEPLRQLGARIDYLGREGYPPLKIHGGGMRGGKIELGPTLSSQYISAMLQIGPYTRQGIELAFQGPITSKPYVQMTTSLMKDFGATARTGDFTHIAVPPGPYVRTNYAVEPDASNASYFLAAAAIIPGSRCTIEGLDVNSVQGDSAFIEVLGAMRAGTFYNTGGVITLESPRPTQLRGITRDLNDIPDMVQTMAIVALFADGPTTIRNVGNLRVKETDRLAALDNELTKLGATVRIVGDDITITPPANGRIRPAAIDTYDDHRMAMAFAVVGLRAEGVAINDPACVNKTFPDFFDYLDRLRNAASASATAKAEGAGG